MKTNLFAFVLVFSVAFASVANAEDIFQVGEGSVATPTVKLGDVVDKTEIELKKAIGFAYRIKDRNQGILIGETEKAVLTAHYPIEWPSNSIFPPLNGSLSNFKMGSKEYNDNKNDIERAKLIEILTCIEASPYSAGENKPNPNWDSTKPTKCLVRAKISQEGSKFYLSMGLATLAEISGASSPEAFLMDHYKFSMENASKFLPGIPLFRNAQYLREGLLDPYIRSGKDPSDPDIGEWVFWGTFTIAMILLVISLPWVTEAMRYRRTGSRGLGKFEYFLVFLALVFLGGLMVWFHRWPLNASVFGLGLVLIAAKGGEINKAKATENSPIEEDEEEEDE
jgi:hypothetical protein